MLKRIRSTGHNSLDFFKEPPKMTHAESAHLCTEIVEKYKGNKALIDEKCKKIREEFFNQYRVK